jgi:hypothetical protein
VSALRVNAAAASHYRLRRAQDRRYRGTPSNVSTLYDVHVEAAQAVAESLRQVVVGISLAHEERSPEAVRSGARQLLTTMVPLRGSTPNDLYLRTAWRSDMSTQARAALWLIDTSAHSILNHLNRDESQDWDEVGAASCFAESGVEQLQQALASSR